MQKIIKIYQRFEYIIIFHVVSYYFYQSVLTIWSSVALVKGLFTYHLKLTSILIAAIFISSLFFTNRESINTLNTILLKLVYILYTLYPI